MHHRRSRKFTYVSPCVKFSIFVSNFIILLFGCLLLFIGLYASYDKVRISNSLRFDNVYDIVVNLSLVIIVSGSLIFAVSFTGCMGALRENTCLLSFYTLCLVCLFVIEIGVAMIGLVFPHSISQILEQNFSNKAISLYQDDVNLQSLVNYVQQEFQCCGLSSAGYLDWSMNEYFNCTSRDLTTNSGIVFSESCDVPFSCCVNATDTMCGKGMQKLPVAQASERIWTSGCVETIRIFVERNLHRIAIAALIAASLQMFIIYLTRTLERQIDLQRALRQRKPKLLPQHHHHSHHHHRRPRNFTYVSSCVKFSIFVLNFTFWLLGCLLIAVGLYASYDKWTATGSLKIDNLYDFIINISLVLMVTGSLVFVVSFAGCIGALRENTCLLSFYILCLLCLFLFELGIAVTGFVFPHSLNSVLEQNFSDKVISSYRDDIDLQNFINYIQKEFQCCGLSSAGYLDWSKNEYFNCTTYDALANSAMSFSESCDVPFSCCVNATDAMCGKGVQKLPVAQASRRIWTSGCIEVIRILVERHLYRIAVGALITALSQMFIIYLARTLEGQIDLQKSQWHHR